MIEKIKKIVKTIISNYNILFLVLGIIMGILSGLSSLLIIFMFPLIVLSFLSNKKKTFLFLIFGFLVIYAPFALANHYLNENNVSWSSKIKSHFKNLYNIFLDEVSMVEPQTIAESNIAKNIEKKSNVEFHKEKIIDDFDSKTTGYIFETNINNSPKIQISSLGYKNKSLRISFDIPVKEDMIIGKELSEKNWQDYIFVSFWIKSTSDYGLFEFIIEDEDGDWWHYFNNELLLNNEWQEVKINLRSLENPDWTKHGNSKLNLNSVKRFYFNFNSPETQTEQTRYVAYIDEITLVS